MQSALDQLKALEAQKAELAEQAYSEALQQAEEAVSALNSLGYDYTLTNGSKPKRTTRKPKDTPCKICGFKTDPPHDARAHRSQAEKRPFTDEELAQLGMTKVE